MKKIFLKLAFFIVIAFILDRLIGTCLSHLFFKTYEGDFGGRINLALKGKPEVLILGSSRAEHHYIPRIIAKNTGFSVFNAGMDGQSIFYHYCIQQLVFERHIPKLIVLEFRPDDLYLNGNDALERLSVLLPYNGNNKVKEILKFRSPFEALKFFSMIYPYNSKILGILKFNYYKNAEGSSARNGYTPLFGQISDELLNSAKKRLPEKASKINTFDPLKVSIFKRIIEGVIKNKIKFLLVESPSWYPDVYQKNQKQMEKEWGFIKNILYLYKVDLYRCNEEIVAFREKVFFNDFKHLNDAGSQIFSKFIAIKINNMLKDKNHEAI